MKRTASIAFLRFGVSWNGLEGEAWAWNGSSLVLLSRATDGGRPGCPDGSSGPEDDDRVTLVRMMSAQARRRSF